MHCVLLRTAFVVKEDEEDLNTTTGTENGTDFPSWPVACLWGAQLPRHRIPAKTQRAVGGRKQELAEACVWLGSPVRRTRRTDTRTRKLPKALWELYLLLSRCSLAGKDDRLAFNGGGEWLLCEGACVGGSSCCYCWRRPSGREVRVAALRSVLYTRKEGRVEYAGRGYDEMLERGPHQGQTGEP